MSKLIFVQDSKTERCLSITLPRPLLFLRGDVTEPSLGKTCLLHSGEEMAHASPGMGNCWHISRTSWRTCSCVSLSPAGESTLAMKEAMRFISSVPKPLVVTAGVPSRIPLVISGGLGSKGMVFLFTELPAT